MNDSPSEGFDSGEIERIIAAVPVATHNQRGLGTLHIGLTEGCDDEIDAAVLLAIAEDAMSSEIYELMKRSDEAHVVEKAHRRPRFVEDCVREMVRGASTRSGDSRTARFVSARQENLETIHQHNVVAERFGTARRDPPGARDRRASQRSTRAGAPGSTQRLEAPKK